jgi:DNA polymerase-3 subunit alpha
MAAVLSRNISDIKKITTFMDETKRMGINVLGPDIHESHIKFTVNPDGNIRFGLGAIKGVGESASQCIIDERNNNGPFRDIYDFVERINLTTVNKKNMEALAASGALDCFSTVSREQYFQPDSKEIIFIEHLMRYGNKFQNELSANQPSLFGGDNGPEMIKPVPPKAEEWSKLEKLNKEKDLVGIYLSAHPLDDYRLEIENFCNTAVSELHDLKSLNGRDITIAGIVTNVRNGTTKTGRPFGILTVQDYTDSYRIPFFANDYINFSKFFAVGYFLLINGKVQPKPFNKEELEFKVKSMNILSDVRDEIIKSITLRIPISTINDDFISSFEKAIGKKRGKIELKFVLFDPNDKISVDMFSRSTRVHLNNTLVNFLEGHQEIEYSVK